MSVFSKCKLKDGLRLRPKFTAAMADDAAALAPRTSQLRQMKEWEKEGLITAKKFSKAQDAILSAHLCLPESAFQDTPEQVPTSHSRNSTGGVRGPNRRLLSEEDSGRSQPTIS